MQATDAQKAARATWSAGDFDSIAEHIWPVGEALVERVGVKAGEDVLDVACGTGNAAIPAAVAGAKVTGVDITPELFEPGRRRAGKAGVEIEWVEGDAQDLSFADESFDVVLPTFGCMFAPDHERAASEIARVLRPGGRMGIASWNPTGDIGRFFKTIAAHAPEPPPGFKPPPMWGDRAHVAELFSGTAIEPRFEDAEVEFRFESIELAVQEWSDKFGPIVLLRAALEPQGRWPALRDDLAGMFEDVNRSEDGGVFYTGAYLIALGEKAGG